MVEFRKTVSPASRFTDASGKTARGAVLVSERDPSGSRDESSVAGTDGFTLQPEDSTEIAISASTGISRLAVHRLIKALLSRLS
jgi:hypothetical protein